MERIALVVQHDFLNFDQMLNTVEAKERYSILSTLHQMFLQKCNSQAKNYTISLQYFQATLLHQIMGEYVTHGYASLGAIYLELSQKITE